MSKNSGSGSSGVGFCGLLTVAFTVLKLTGHIDWSWWWVTAPLWIPGVLAIVVVFVGAYASMSKNSKG